MRRQISKEKQIADMSFISLLRPVRKVVTFLFGPSHILEEVFSAFMEIEMIDFQFSAIHDQDALGRSFPLQTRSSSVPPGQEAAIFFSRKSSIVGGVLQLVCLDSFRPSSSSSSSFSSPPHHSGPTILAAARTPPTTPPQQPQLRSAQVATTCSSPPRQQTQDRPFPLRRTNTRLSQGSSEWSPSTPILSSAVGPSVD